MDWFPGLPFKYETDFCIYFLSNFFDIKMAKERLYTREDICVYVRPYSKRACVLCSTVMVYFQQLFKHTHVRYTRHEVAR